MTSVEEFGGHEGFEIFVVGLYSYRVFGSFEVVSPMFHRFDDSEHFMVVGVIIAFSWGAFAGPEGDRVKLIFVRLRNDSGDGEARGISMECDREFWVKMMENGTDKNRNFSLSKAS